MQELQVAVVATPSSPHAKCCIFSAAVTIFIHNYFTRETTIYILLASFVNNPCSRNSEYKNKIQKYCVVTLQCSQDEVLALRMAHDSAYVLKASSYDDLIILLSPLRTACKNASSSL